MIVRLYLENFRGFEQHNIPFRRRSIIVGRNNAGKSTTIEALRMVSLVCQRVEHLNFVSAPNWIEETVPPMGVKPSLGGTSIKLKGSSYRYNEVISKITAIFENKVRITIYINGATEDIFCTIHSTSVPITSRSQVRTIKFPRMSVMPPIGPLAEVEEVLNPEYVRKKEYRNIAPLHFRNQLLYSDEITEPTRVFQDEEDASSRKLPQGRRFREFVTLAEENWPQLSIHEFSRVSIASKELSLLIRDGSFVAEVGEMGHGLQSWLQTLWFLTKTSDDSTIVLDEPDVYLHADLQRKLIKILDRRFQQVIVATHSIEILSEVDPSEVLMLDKSRKHSNFASNLPVLQGVIDNIGGVHNLQLARLWASRRCVFVEGDDITFLAVFHNTLFPTAEIAFEAFPSIPLHGAGNWRHAIGAAIALKKAADESIRTYCILDRDYRSADEVGEIERVAKENGLNIHVLRSKEIENYVISATAIERFVRANGKGGRAPKVSTIERRVESICEDLRGETVDALVVSALARLPKTHAAKVSKSAREYVDKNWNSLQNKIKIVGGKLVMSRLSSWSKEAYGVSFSPISIARSMLPGEIDVEILELLEKVELRKVF